MRVTVKGLIYNEMFFKLPVHPYRKGIINLYSDYDLGNGVNTTLSFDQYGYPDKIETVKGTIHIQDRDYDFNTTFGNMTKRKGLKPNGVYIEETFAYDSQDRLLAVFRRANGTTLTYDTGGEGNITFKSDVGTYIILPISCTKVYIF
ncbi:MAG: hypothetical protein ACP5D1_10445 [Bacteroidales bacterium]